MRSLRTSPGPRRFARVDAVKTPRGDENSGPAVLHELFDHAAVVDGGNGTSCVVEEVDGLVQLDGRQTAFQVGPASRFEGQ